MSDNNDNKTAWDLDDIIRGMIAHEDDQINARIGWSTAAHTFLFNALSHVNYSKYLIPSAGIFIALLTIWGIVRAFEARARLIEWHDEYGILPDKTRRPPIMGRMIGSELTVKANRDKRFSALMSPNLFLPIILGALWVYALMSELKLCLIILSILGFLVAAFMFGFRFIIPKDVSDKST
jgi:hypothetical protein